MMKPSWHRQLKRPGLTIEQLEFIGQTDCSEHRLISVKRNSVTITIILTVAI